MRRGARWGRNSEVPIYTLPRSQTVRLSLNECWAFFSNPGNLARITPPSLGFRVESELPDEIYPGLMIHYSVSPLWSIPVRWLTEMTQVRKPDYFLDEQRIGPYRIWHHEHFFRALDDGQTEVRDLVHYVPPFGQLGALLNDLLILPQLLRIFDFRAHKLEEMSEAGPRDSFA